MTKEDMVEMLKPDNIIAVTTWMTLGDGNITIPDKGVNGFFQVSHSDDHEDYIRMKSGILGSITGNTVKRYYHSRSDKYNWQLWTKCHPVFTSLRSRIYLDGRKVLSTHAIKMLTPMCLAILYQDDGRYSEEKSTISINKPLFSKLELETLAKYIVDSYGIIFRVRRSCTLKDGSIGHELGLRWSDKDRFFSIISPYIVPSMFYKVARGSSPKLAMVI